jgi:hypothetical protein
VTAGCQPAQGVFSSEVAIGSREENTTNQKPSAPILISSELERWRGSIASSIASPNIASKNKALNV